VNWTLDNIRILLEKVTVRDAEDIHKAAVALNDSSIELGFKPAISADIASKNQIIDADGSIINADIFGWVDDGQRWWEDSRLALKSFLPRACRYECEPFWCNSDGFHSRWRNKYLEGIKLKDFEQFVFGKAAVVVPVHLSFGQIGAASFMPLDANKRDLADDFEKHGDILGQISRRFIASYVAAMRTSQWIPSNCALSKREVECLHWAAIGKTDREVSEILTLSHATVRYHLQRAGEKLNAVNRSQAVFKAGQLGFLGSAS
jgi:DNA-binding CsgD family transcriptional regulator